MCVSLCAKRHYTCTHKNENRGKTHKILEHQQKPCEQNCGGKRPEQQSQRFVWQTYKAKRVSGKEHSNNNRKKALIQDNIYVFLYG